MIVEEVFSDDGDDDVPESHVQLVEELTAYGDDDQVDPLLEVGGKSNRKAGRGKKKARKK